MDPIVLMMLFLVVLLSINFFGNKKRKSAQEILRSNLKPGAKVVTSGGIKGELVSVTGDHAVIKSGASTLEFHAGAIREAIPASPTVKASTQAKTPAKKPATSVASKASAKAPVTKPATKK